MMHTLSWLEWGVGRLSGAGWEGQAGLSKVCDTWAALLAPVPDLCCLVPPCIFLCLPVLQLPDPPSAYSIATLANASLLALYWVDDLQARFGFACLDSSLSLLSLVCLRANTRATPILLSLSLVSFELLNRRRSACLNSSLFRSLSLSLSLLQLQHHDGHNCQNYLLPGPGGSSTCDILRRWQLHRCCIRGVALRQQRAKNRHIVWDIADA